MSPHEHGPCSAVPTLGQFDTTSVGRCRTASTAEGSWKHFADAGYGAVSADCGEGAIFGQRRAARHSAHCRRHGGIAAVANGAPSRAISSGTKVAARKAGAVGIGSAGAAAAKAA